jgi:hypothetical protein
MMAEALLSWMRLFTSNSAYRMLGVGAVFVIYAGMDYFLLDYLMLVPGKIYAFT